MPYSYIARAVEDRFHRELVPALKRLGWRPRAIAYDGYGSCGDSSMVRVMARMVMRPPNAPAEGPLFTYLPESLPSSAAQAREMAWTSLLEAQRGWRSFIDAPVPYLPVTVTVGDVSVRTRADRGGYVDVVLRNHGLEPGWHDALIDAAGAGHVRSRVRIISSQARIGVVCDIDDTAMITHVPRVAVAAWNLLVKNSSAREPVAGMADLLNALQQENEGAPVIYLSTGAWNVVPTLRTFFKRHHFPDGPTLMTDWGPTNTGWFRSGIEHKRTELRRLMIDLPHLRWVLIGDDGQFDPVIYSEAAREHADRVAAIGIRRLTPTQHMLSSGLVHPMDLGPHARTAAESTVPVVSGIDGYDLARALPADLLPSREPRIAGGPQRD